MIHFMMECGEYYDRNVFESGVDDDVGFHVFLQDAAFGTHKIKTNSSSQAIVEKFGFAGNESDTM